MISLGCDKNRVDSEKMLYLIKSAGYTVSDNAEDADIIIVNTCAFIESAKKEAIEVILNAAELKNARLKKLIVTGCFAERYRTEVDFPEVDRFVSLSEEADIVEILEDLGISLPCKSLDENIGRVQTTPAHYAYLKIADGCDNRCSFCAIPYIRGKYRSLPIERLVKEAEELVNNGVKELILVAQDTTRYGCDLYGKPSLVTLLRALSALPVWKIRILYAYPELIDEELLLEIANNEKIAKYLDIPLQHADDELLKKMNRRGRDYEALLKKVRSVAPDIALRSSFICGFPYETEEKHRSLLSFLEHGVDFGGFFAYSPEEGTPAYLWKDRAPARTVKRWIAECEDAQTKHTLLRQRRFLDKTIEVLYEGIDFDKQLFYGRSEFNAPEIDTLVYFKADFPLLVGSVYRVKIEKTDFNLYGYAVEESI